MSRATDRDIVYDGDALVLEYDGAGNRLQRHVHLDGADTPVLSYHASETSPRQLMPDHQGSIVSMTQHGWNRIVVNSYDEYGYPGANNTGRFQYTGQAWLAELGLYYYKARMYSPGMGRFMQTDPIGYGDGLNWYDYVGGDPVNKTDPSGLAQFCYQDSSQTVGSVEYKGYRKEFTPKIICQWFDDPIRGQTMPSTPPVNPGRGNAPQNKDQDACSTPFFRNAINNAEFQKGIKAAVAMSKNTPSRFPRFPSSEAGFTYGPRIAGSGYAATSPFTTYGNGTVEYGIGEIRARSYLRNVHPLIYVHTHTPGSKLVLSGEGGDIGFSNDHDIPIIAYDYEKDTYMCHMDR